MTEQMVVFQISLEDLEILLMRSDRSIKEGTVPMRSKLSLLVLSSAVFISACSDPPLPTKLADIDSSQHGSAFYRYRPGSILDDYITVEVDLANERATLLSLGKCKLVAAKFNGNKIDFVLFEADFSVMASSNLPDVQLASPFELQIKTFNRAPSEGEIQALKQDGFSTVKCDF